MFKTWILFAAAAVLHASIFAGTFFSEDFSNGLGKKWEPVKFEGMTDYTIVKEQDNPVLEARANGTASGLGAKVNIPVRPGTTFSWRWKIDHTPKNASDDEKKSFDHSARLFIAFKTALGPPRTINYVWANRIAAGKTFHHPSSGRSRFIVLESGDAKAGQWQTYSRDLAADWKLLFGDDEAPNVVGIGLMTDSDGTKGQVTGFYDDLQISSK